MMKEYKYHLSVKDCRAIKTAEIDLSEITVLTGINASGKSTISRMFRDLVEMSAEYERLLAVQVWKQWLDVWRYALERDYLLGRLDISRRLARGEMSLSKAVDLLRHILQDTLNKDSIEGKMSARLRRFLHIDDSEKDILSVFERKSNKVLKVFSSRCAQRSYSTYRDLLKNNPLREGECILTEGEKMIFSSRETASALSEISFIRRAIYIESPFKSIPSAGRELSAELDMNDGYLRIKGADAPRGFPAFRELADVLSGTVDCEGDRDVGDSPNLRDILGPQERWMYNREDGKSFELDECATGIRSLAILNILYANGWLDAETLLIIDEPETHLHPQWVVEYARLLLLLSKRLKVRILITSHSPDMINAIHTIGMSLNMGEVMNFYLAEQDEVDKYKYNFRSLGNHVGAIFKAYNTAFERIDNYATRGVR